MHEKSRRILIIAKNIGFCSGVSRAVNIAEELSKRYGNIFTLDEILHNDKELERLSSIGIKLASMKNHGKVILLPAHGASSSEIKNLSTRFEEIVDATCPLVLRTVKIIDRLKREGYAIAIVGDKGHRETMVLSESSGDKLLGVFENVFSVKMSNRIGKVALVSQSTAEKERLFEIAEELMKRAFEFRMYNTICEETLKRQEEAIKIASIVDCMIVVGSKKSANSRRLYEKVLAVNSSSKFVNSEEEILQLDLSKCNKVGITSGTSTPDWLIGRVVEILRKEQK